MCVCSGAGSWVRAGDKFFVLAVSRSLHLLESPSSKTRLGWICGVYFGGVAGDWQHKV